MSDNSTHDPVPDDPEFHLPKDHWPLPELSLAEPEHPHPHPAPTIFVQMQQSEKFIKLRRSFRLFAFPTVVAVLAWYFLYVLLSTFAEGFMSTPVFGNLNVGILIGLAQFPTTWFATWVYVWRADNILDPLAAELRDQIESEEIR